MTQPLRDSNSKSPTGSGALGPLPVWNLDDLYRSPDDKAIGKVDGSICGGPKTLDA